MKRMRSKIARHQNLTDFLYRSIPAVPLIHDNAATYEGFHGPPRNRIPLTLSHQQYIAIPHGPLNNELGLMLRQQAGKIESVNVAI